MIEQIMYFALGLLMAALVTIALLPALWRRAVRLTQSQLEATLPLSPEEIAAEKDQLRAAHAVELRRMETRLEAAESALQVEKTEGGAKTTAIQLHEATIARQSEAMEAQQAELRSKREQITGLEQDIAILERERDNLATNLSAARITNQALDQDIINLRQLAGQSQARASEAEAQVAALTQKLADSQTVATQLRSDLQGKSDELRQAARKLREAAEQVALANRKLTAAETLANDHQRTIDDLQIERLNLIDEAGQLTRERDHERIERAALQNQVDLLSRQVSEASATVATTRGRQGDVVRDLTRTVETLRKDKRASEEDASRLRLEKTMLEGELRRLSRAHALQVERGDAPPLPLSAAAAATTVESAQPALPDLIGEPAATLELATEPPAPQPRPHKPRSAPDAAGT